MLVDEIRQLCTDSLDNEKYEEMKKECVYQIRRKAESGKHYHDYKGIYGTEYYNKLSEYLKNEGLETNLLKNCNGYHILQIEW